MPARSKITLLPDDLRAELERRLITSGFSNYYAIAQWLRAQDVDISRSAIHRFGQEFATKCEAIKIATEQAKAIVTVVGDDEGNMNEALIRLIQQLSFDILIKNQDADISSLLPKMGVMVAKLSKASVDQKKWMSEMRVKTKQTAEDVVMVAKKGGMSEKTAEEIRKKILGIV
jgi:intein-encoded DNA endonuclease-like protein